MQNTFKLYDHQTILFILKIRTAKILLLVKLLIIVMLLSSCKSRKNLTLRYLDHYEIPANARFKKTIIGGLSGIDYDAVNQHFYMVSDDRSEHNYARFYKVKIELKEQKIDTLIFRSVIPILTEKGTYFDLQTSDFESIRLNSKNNILVIGDEGGNNGETAIRIIDLKGKNLNTLTLDTTYLANIRDNNSLESLSFSKNFKNLYYATETALIKDGEKASIFNKSLIRIIAHDVENEAVKKEWLYWLEKVPQKEAIKPPWKGAGSDNGLSEILTIEKNKLLALERSGAYQEDGSFNYVCKLFCVILKNKKSNKNINQETIKKEVFNFSSLPFKTYNIEGMTLGPVIDGNQTLLLISDNNFNEKTPTVVYLFIITNY